jgi:hypothetical protein
LKPQAAPILRRCVRPACRSSTIDQDGTLYFDLHHTHNDTLDKIDPVALELNVEAYARVLARAANR